ncbi:hypothetical protein N9W79_02145, partial [bacterium]|nr:hypothetical protein [bacterium]
SDALSGQKTMTLKLLTDSANMQFQLFQLYVWENVRQCFDSSRTIAGLSAESYGVCSLAKDSLMALLNDPSFYLGNTHVFSTFKDQPDTQLKVSEKSLSKEYVDNLARIYEFVRTNVLSSGGIRLFNNISLSGSGLTPALIKLDQFVDKVFDRKGYGFVASLDKSKIDVFKGDSGSILLFNGTPIAALSTYEGEPVSSGLASAVPAVSPETVFPEIDSGPADSVSDSGPSGGGVDADFDVPAPSDIASVEIGTASSEVSDTHVDASGTVSGEGSAPAENSFSGIIADANERAVGTSNCL